MPPLDISKLGFSHDEVNKLDIHIPVIVCTTNHKQNISVSIYLKLQIVR